MNPVLSSVISAQDSYMRSLSVCKDAINTDSVLVAADRAIRDAMDKGQFTCAVHPIEDVRIAELAAIQLAERGYTASVVAAGMVPSGDGSGFKQAVGVQLNWKWLPGNSRDEYTV